MAEQERAAVFTRTHEVHRDQAVERGECRRSGQRRGGRGQLGIERLAGDGGALQQRPRLRVQRANLPRDGGDQRSGQLAAAAGELAQEQRVAARVGDDPPAQLRVGDAAEEALRVGVGQRRQRQRLPPGRAERGLQQPLRGGAGTGREDQQLRRFRRTAQQVQHQLE